MKVTLEELQNPITVTISGDEDWLNDLYTNFLKSKGSSPKLTGEITIKLDGYGYASVSGNLSYMPYVPCSRCADPISWPINKSFEARFKPKDEVAEASEVDLVADDFEYYYVENDTLDIQQVIVDTILTTLPSQLILKTEDNKSCRACGKDITDSEVYRSKAKEDESPFAVLKNLKLPN